MKQQNKKAYDSLVKKHTKARRAGSDITFYKELLETPVLLKLAGNVKNKKVLDLGCGPGFQAKALTKKGARVTGIDNSKESITLAEQESPKSTFVVGDIEKLPFARNSFDTVFSAMVICHLKDWNKVLAEVRRVLKKNGTFVFSIYNPVYEVLAKKKCGKSTVKVIDRYFEERTFYNNWDGYTVSHHHKTYGTIIKLLCRHGFFVEDYEDCKPPKSAQKKYPKEYAKNINFPTFCVWKVKK